MGQQAIHGLALGSIYALLAVGLTFMYGAQRSLYLAYGGLYALGGYITWWIMRSTHTIWIALGIAVLLCTLAGLLLQGWSRMGRRDTPEYAKLLAGLGFLVCLEEIYRLGIGPYRMKVIAIDSHQIHSIGPLMVTDMHWLVFGCTFAFFTTLQGFFSTSRSGRALYGLLQDDSTIVASGIEASRLRWLACGLGAALAGVSGALAGLYLNDVHPAMGTVIIHKILALVLIGALGRLQGAVLSAFALALVEGVVLPATRLPLPSEAMLLIALAFVGFFRPQEAYRPCWRYEG